MTITVTARFTNPDNSYQVEMVGSNTVRTLREKLSTVSNVPEEQLRIVHAGEELKDFSKTIVDAGFHANTIVHVLTGTNGEPKYQEPIGRESVFGFKWGKWVVRNFERGNVQVNDATSAQAVGVFDSKNTIVNIHSKINHLDVVNCENCIIVLKGVISSLELTRCTNTTIISSGKVSTIQLDLSRECHIVLPPVVLSSAHVVASSTDSILINGQKIETSLFEKDQRVTYFDGPTKKWKTVGAGQIQDSDGYLLIGEIRKYESS